MGEKKEQFFNQLAMITAFFRNNLLLIALSISFLTIGGTVYASKAVTPIYYSTAEIYIRSGEEEQYMLEGVLVSEDLTADSVEISQSIPVLEEAIFNSGLQDIFTAESIQEQMYVYTDYQGRLLFITVADIDAGRAQLLTQKISESAVKYINHVMESDWAVIADNANFPQNPEYPVVWKTAVQCFCYGIGVFFFISVLFSLQDYRINSSRDVEKYLGLCILGSIPKYEKGSGHK